MDDIIKILLIVTLIVLVIIILRSNKSNKYNNRISKYTIKNNNAKRVSLGDRILGIHNKLRKSIVKSLKNSTYFKNKAIKYERFSYIDTPINLIATKFTFSIIVGLIYLISSIYKSTFDVFVLLQD